MPPLELEQLFRRLDEEFGGRITLPAGGSEQQRRAGYLTRALAAYTIRQLSGCTIDEAVASIVDAGGDGGIDAIHYSVASHRLYMVQAKAMQDGSGEPASGDILKFQQGVEAVLAENLDHFTAPLWTPKKAIVQQALGDELLEVLAVLAYTSVRVIEPQRLRGFEEVRARVSTGSTYFSFRPYNLTSITDWVLQPAGGNLVIDLVFKDPGCPQAPYETIYGQISAQSLADLYVQHGLRLVEENIRVYKGNTKVNEGICTTASTEPLHLFYFNNGLTAHCKRFHIDHRDRGNATTKRVKAYGFSVVNGAQTLGSLGKEAARLGALDPNAVILVRLISLERCLDDIGFGERITRNSNFQNQIGPRDFVTQRPEHARWKDQLALEGVHYHYQDGDDEDGDDENLSIKEALTALASLCTDHDCDLVAKVLGDRKSIWLLDLMLPENAPTVSRYEAAFSGGMSARALWRAVLLQRHVIDVMKTSTSAEVDRRKQFYQHSRFLVLHLVAIRLRFDREAGMTMPETEKTDITRVTQEVAEALWTAGDLRNDNRHFRTIFANAADCQRLKGATLAALAATT